eukprot:3747211-Pyramimonas_sp.AAC.1
MQQVLAAARKEGPEHEQDVVELLKLLGVPCPAAVRHSVVCYWRSEGSQWRSLFMETLNGSCWKTIRRRLRETSAVIVRAHEIGIITAFLGQATATARPLGSHVLFSLSLLNGGAGKCSCGVAAFARLSVGLRWPPEGPSPVVPGRAIKVPVDFPGWPTVSVLSIYSKTAEGLSESNIQVIAEIGKKVHDATHIVLAGDWDLPPQVLEASGVPRKLGMLVLAPIEHARRTPSATSTVDFFVMGPGLARLISGVSAAMSWDVKPHRPIRLK